MTRQAHTKRDSGQPRARIDASVNGSRAKIEWADPNALVPFARNPMTHSEEQIAQITRSIQTYGFTIPILTDENKMILAGHGRQIAAVRLEMRRVPIIVKRGLSTRQKHAYVLADNKIARNADYDQELLRGLLKDLQTETELELTGFSGQEVEQLLATLGESSFVVNTPPVTDTFAEGTQFQDNRPVRITLRCSEAALTEQFKVALDAFCREHQLTCVITTG